MVSQEQAREAERTGGKNPTNPTFPNAGTHQENVLYSILLSLGGQATIYFRHVKGSPYI